MDAETQAVVDAAWAVVNEPHPERNLLYLKAKLRVLLQDYAKVHPPELPKKDGDSRAPDYCLDCGRQLRYLHRSLDDTPLFLHRIDSTSDCRVVSNPGDCPYLESRSTGSMLPKKPGENRPEPEGRRPEPPPMVGGVGMPTPPGYTSSGPPAARRPDQPPLQLEHGDMCVVHLLNGVSIHIPAGAFQILRPAKGDE